MGRYKVPKEGGKPKLQEKPKPVTFQQYTTVIGCFCDLYREILDALSK